MITTTNKFDRVGDLGKNPLPLLEHTCTLTDSIYRKENVIKNSHKKNSSPLPDSPKYIIAAHVDAMTAPGRLPGIVGQA